MSHTICGIDLGAFSVKFVLLEVGFRQTHIRGLLETAVPSFDAPLLERQAQAVRDGFERVSGEATPYLAIPGDLLSVRLLELPFADPRKIDQVVGYELEGQIVHALEDVVYDHIVVRAAAEGSTVLAVAAKRDEVASLLAGLQAQGTEPRALYAAPVVYRALLEQTEPGAGGGCKAILDLGHLRTNLCVVAEASAAGGDGNGGGGGIYARTITRGGFHLTTAIAQAFDTSYDRAEQAKRGEAYLVSGTTPANSPLTVKLDSVLREALAPLVRDIRQTLASFRASSKRVVDTIYITGGTGRLKGMPEFLQSELGMPARFLDVKAALESRPRVVEPGGDGPPDAVMSDDSSSHALSAAIALTASRGRKEIDLRRGPFVYRANFSVLRQKAAHLGLLVAALLLAGGLDVYAAFSNLGDERKELDKKLKTATQELFGQPREDAQAVSLLLKKGFKEDLAPLPKATGFDLLDQISRKMPDDEKIKLDVMELDIRPKKTFMKGTVDSATAVDEMASKLKEIECYEEVTKGAITEISGGGKQFTLTVTSKCP
jgi:Tfp pilus assembly PilM family ATPase